MICDRVKSEGVNDVVVFRKDMASKVQTSTIESNQGL